MTTPSIKPTDQQTSVDYPDPFTDSHSLRSLAAKCGLPFLDLSCFTADADLVAMFPSRELTSERVLPLSIAEDSLKVAVGDPFKLESLARHPAFTGYRLETVLADEVQILVQLNRVLGVGSQTVSELIRQQPVSEIVVQTSTDVEAHAEASIARLVDELLKEAVEQRASDIHIETGDEGIRIRFRVDGLLRSQSVPPDADQFCAVIISRIKILSGLNIAERRLPQDGRFDVVINNGTVDVRASVMPMVRGEEVVLRLVDKSRTQFDLAGIEFPESILKSWTQLVRRPHGMVLVTGPTGSGKTTTLYSSLCHVQSMTTKIVTVEDPVEHQLPGINQIQVHEKIGLTFGESLRRILRHDPDILLVGEIRDADTARTAIQASLTGHQVLSTLHANDSSSAYTRLIDMGVEPYLVSSTVIGVMSQRLVRRLCLDCRESYSPHSDELPSDLYLSPGQTIFRANGCSKCCQTGYTGRVALFELLVPNDSIRRLCLTNAAPSMIQERAVADGMTTLRESGWNRVTAGLTSISEVLRACEPLARISPAGSTENQSPESPKSDAESLSPAKSW